MGKEGKGKRKIREERAGINEKKRKLKRAKWGKVVNRCRKVERREKVGLKRERQIGGKT